MTDQERPASTTSPDDASLPEVLDYVKKYALQETLGPIKGAGRWLGYGVAGAVALGLGLLFVLLGILRLVQTEWDRSSHGSWSWLPYLIVVIVAGALIAVTVSRISKSSLNKELK